MQTEMDTNEIYSNAIKAVGAKRIAHALGLSLSHTYRLARPTMDVDPDGTGARSDLDRVELFVDLLAARPGGRVVLVQMRQWFDALFNRALGAWGGGELTEDTFRGHVGRAVSEFGEAVSACQTQALACDEARAALRTELHEAIAELKALDAALGAHDQIGDRGVRLDRAG